MSWSSGRLNQKSPKLGAVDLNLLVVFDAIMRDRSVTRAGQRLGLSQPAMSHALTRLRHMLKDELFVRSPNGMMPTPRAEELATPIRIALDGLQQSLEPVQFEPSKATATFRIAVDNYAAIVLVAPIAAHIARVAPGVTLDFRPSGTLNVAKTMTRSHPFISHRLSRSPKPIEAAMIWLRRLDNQPAHAWLRDVITGVASDFRAG